MPRLPAEFSTHLGYVHAHAAVRAAAVNADHNPEIDGRPFRITPAAVGTERIVGHCANLAQGLTRRHHVALCGGSGTRRRHLVQCCSRAVVDGLRPRRNVLLRRRREAMGKRRSETVIGCRGGEGEGEGEGEVE